MQTQHSLDEATDRLEHNAVFVGILPALVIGAILLFVQPVVAIVVALAIGVGWVLAVRARLAGAVQRAVSPLGGVPLDPVRHPRLDNVLEGLCATSGVRDASVSVVESPAVNAMAATDRDTTAIVVTSALVDQLDRLEMEGVLANLLARVKDGSARYATTVLALFGPSSTAHKLLAQHLGDQRPVMSDLAAVDLTRYPPGLIAALAKMDEQGTGVGSVAAASAPLWVASPIGAGHAAAEDTSEDQPLSLRIAVLSEL